MRRIGLPCGLLLATALGAASISACSAGFSAASSMQPSGGAHPGLAAGAIRPLRGLNAVLSEPGWSRALSGEFAKPYFADLAAFLGREKRDGRPFLPEEKLIFNAFNSTPLAETQVVILGQDPYPTPGHAMGLAFSVAESVETPQSLANIFKELNDDLGVSIPRSGNLSGWAQQGVFLLNTVLTVPPHEAGGHRGHGWETFTDAVIRLISAEREGVVFLLWGTDARKKAQLIDSRKHFILEAAHPSPLSARSGFFGCRHFSRTNELLAKAGKRIIDW